MCGTSYRLVLHREAAREIRAVPKRIRSRIREFIDSLAADPRPPGVVPLKGRKNVFRYRIGDYRILYEVHATEIVIFVIGVAHRREVYVRLLRRR